MTTETEMSLYVLILAVYFGIATGAACFAASSHTPLMSLTNAISAISVVGAILVAGVRGRDEAQP